MDRRAAGAVLGLAALACAMGVAELTAGLLGEAGTSPVVAVGDAAVDYSPQPLAEFAISLFGVYDKLVLLVGIGTVLALFAALLGLQALKRAAVGYAGIAVFAAVGVAAALARRDGDLVSAIPVLAGAAAGAVALAVLLRFASSALRAAPEPVAAAEPMEPSGSEESATAAEPPPGSASAPTDIPRRRFVLAAGTAFAAAGAAAVAGRLLPSGAGEVEAARAALDLPEAAEPLPPIPAGADLDVSGLSSFITPNNDFYRIDTALTVPRVAPQEWTLRIHGMVDDPFEIDFDALLRRRLVESDTTLCCVSNQVGGDLIGNSRWLGVRLDDLLREAGVHAGADQILSTSSDGWTCGTPTEVVMDGRDAILAIAMDGEPLPEQHGFPARMVVPGLYGYVSATKWVTDIKLTRFADEEAYWISRGWAAEGPVKTMSRIDVPGTGAEVEAGEVTVAGVAWAQNRGIEAVEVRVDGGEWAEAELADVPGIDTWRQWIWEWDAEPGEHELEVRATDATGDTQTEERADVRPDGATGWHAISVAVS